MGGGFYSSIDRATRAAGSGFYTKSPTEIFKSKNINNAMSPYGVTVRESRDSEEHPNSLAIILALDVTGSMLSVPHYLVKNGLPDIMDTIIQREVKDPQVLFMGIGDHECDSAPLQIGQFESSDELLDKWLTSIYLEGGGGANVGESYLLAWYFAAVKTSIDCYEKRKQKGLLFTIGDEPTLRDITKQQLKEVFGDGQYVNMSANELLTAAKEMYDVYHIHVRQTNAGHLQSTIDGWKQLLSDNFIIAERQEDVPRLIADVISTRKQKKTSFSRQDIGDDADVML